MNHATGVDLMAARGAVSPTASAIRLKKNPKAFFKQKTTPFNDPQQN